jgi:hypothetical protein
MVWHLYLWASTVCKSYRNPELYAHIDARRLRFFQTARRRGRRYICTGHSPIMPTRVASSRHRWLDGPPDNCTVFASGETADAAPNCQDLHHCRFKGCSPDVDSFPLETHPLRTKLRGPAGDPVDQLHARRTDRHESDRLCAGVMWYVQVRVATQDQRPQGFMLLIQVIQCHRSRPEPTSHWPCWRCFRRCSRRSLTSRARSLTAVPRNCPSGQS